MKINWFLLLVSFLIAGLSAYGFWAGTENLFLAFGSGASFFITLFGIISVSFGRGSANIKVLSAVFFLLLLIEHLFFAFAGLKQAAYIIITGILLLIYISLFYGIARSLKI